MANITNPTISSSSLYFKLKATMEKLDMQISIDRRIKCRTGYMFAGTKKIVLAPNGLDKNEMFTTLAHEAGHVMSQSTFSKKHLKTFIKAYRAFNTAGDAKMSRHQFETVFNEEVRAWDFAEEIILSFINRSDPLFRKLKQIRIKSLLQYLSWDKPKYIK